MQEYDKGVVKVSSMRYSLQVNIVVLIWYQDGRRRGGQASHSVSQGGDAGESTTTATRNEQPHAKDK